MNIKKKILICIIAVNLVFCGTDASFASVLPYRGAKIVTKDYYFKENFSDNALERICFANNVDYVKTQYIEYIKYTKDDAYIVIDSGKYKKLNLQIMKDPKMGSREFSIDAYMDGEFIARITDFNEKIGVAYNYEINCENKKQIRLQLVSNQNKPIDENLKEFIYIMNAKFS